MKTSAKKSFGICGIAVEFSLADLLMLSHCQHRLERALDKHDDMDLSISACNLNVLLKKILADAPDLTPSTIFDPDEPKES